MGRSNRELSGRQALAARMAAQFDRALADAAETMDLLGGSWDDSALPAVDDGLDLLPLEFQLADLERAVDTMLEERERFVCRSRAEVLGEMRDGSGPGHGTEQDPGLNRDPVASRPGEDE